eukprot:958959-Rhodomonas_salina.2
MSTGLLVGAGNPSHHTATYRASRRRIPYNHNHTEAQYRASRSTRVGRYRTHKLDSLLRPPAAAKVLEHHTLAQ